MIYVVATLTIKPGSLDDVMAGVRPCIEATRQEEGCMSYDIHQSLTEENTLVYVERWRDMDAIKAHFEMPHMGVDAQSCGRLYHQHQDRDHHAGAREGTVGAARRPSYPGGRRRGRRA